MSSGRQELDIETTALIEKLRPMPPRDRHAAANGKSTFLAEAKAYSASVPAAREERPMGRKENAMRLARIPIFLLLIVVIGLGVVFVSSRTLLNRTPQAQTQLNNVEIFVAGQNIPQGAMITEDELATIALPQDKVSAVEFSADEKSQLVGQVAKFPLDQGTVITSAMVMAGQYWAAMGPPPLAVPTNPGLHLGVTKQPGMITNPQPTGGAPIPVPPSAGYTGQMVVKNAGIRLLVADTGRALDGVTQTVADVQGYVISSQTWYQDYNGKNFQYATLTIAVPVDQFESALHRLRSLGVRVLDENASGEDVTGQYVDLQSQLTNLEATRDRIRSFLDQATTVDEALRVNQQLSEVEAQIEQIKGQMNYLSNRTAFSTITISLEPELPQIATPTPTATATPISPLGQWDAGKTTRQATDTLVSAYRLIANFLIWFFVVIVPVLGPPVALIWLAMWLLRRRSKAAAKGQGAQGPQPTDR